MEMTTTATDVKKEEFLPKQSPSFFLKFLQVIIQRVTREEGGGREMKKNPKSGEREKKNLGNPGARSLAVMQLTASPQISH